MNPNEMHGTTILSVRRNNQVVIGGDGQVSMGDTMMKGNARKVRRLYEDQVIAGFAGGTADAFTLFERFEGKLQKHQGNLVRAAVELTKDWRTDRMLRRLEALKQGKCICSATSETGDNLIFIQTAHFARITFHHGITHRYLPITTNHDLVVTPDRQDRGAMHFIGVHFVTSKN
jgi:hypothetical protein